MPSIRRETMLREVDRDEDFQPMSTHEHSVAGRSRLFDRLFVGGCTAAYAVLIGTVLVALRLYAG